MREQWTSEEFAQWKMSVSHSSRSEVDKCSYKASLPEEPSDTMPKVKERERKNINIHNDLK